MQDRVAAFIRHATHAGTRRHLFGAGQDSRCCSGLCQGKQPKKGEWDTFPRENRCIMDGIRIQFIGRAVAPLLALLLVMAVAEPLAVSAKPAGKKFKTVTRVFSSAGAIAIVDLSIANPYPSTIDVAGFRKGKIRDLNLRLDGFSHSFAADVDMMLVAPDGRRAIVMSDVGGGASVGGLTLALDDEAAASLPPNETLTSGTFRPANLESSRADAFPAPAPDLTQNVALSTFNGANPNGQWRLFVVDALSFGAGEISEGWELEITARVKKNGKGKDRNRK